MSGSSGGFLISDNAALTSLGTAFRSLERISGQLSIYNNLRLTDCDALATLPAMAAFVTTTPRCTARTAPAGSASLINKPTCESFDDPQHSSD